ncbi:uncharacterized protein [Eurosta solidaginis]|uniref:uncharacterized protein n=1 Tax=Eurosta solidaginis TaxID=178769 RepID=UPI00353115E7
MGKKRNPKQEEILLSFMQGNEAIAKGFTKGDRVDVEAKWGELTKSLNAVGPPCKDLAGWKKSWVDWKSTIKKKLSDNRREVNSSGGGPYSQQPISPTEEAIAVLCSLYKSVNGMDGVRRYGPSQAPTTSSNREVPGDGAEKSADESSNSIAESTTNKAATIEPRNTSRARRRSIDTFEKMCMEQNAAFDRIARAFDELLTFKKKELEIKEQEEKERKRHNEILEEIEMLKLETLRKFL